MKLTVKSVRATERNIKLRMPFAYGDVSLTEMPEAQMEVVVETDLGVQIGHAAQMMAPRWFNKAPGLSLADSVNELRKSVHCAVRNAPKCAGSVAQVARSVREASVIELMREDVPLLAAGYGASLFEAALIDATCHAADLSFPAAVRADIFGLAELAPSDLGTDAFRCHLQNVPEPWELDVRHTVGYHSPLTDADAASLRVNDGLPVSLEGAMAATGVNWFKVKLKGSVSEDLEWLLSVDQLISARCPGYRATLDANEQYSPEGLAELLGHVEGDDAFAHFCSAIVFVEQPFAREVALSADTQLPKTRLPLVIDESDDTDDALLRAFELGWSGTSAKSCKGVLHALVNSARVAQRRSRGERAIISAEDLSCQAFLALQQDTLMAMVIGATHVERNGHQFGGALQGYDSDAAATILQRHGDLYRAHDSRPYLNIRSGSMRFSSLNAPGFGSIPKIGLVGDVLAGADFANPDADLLNSP